MKKDDSHVTSVRIPMELFEFLSTEAKNQHRPVSNLIIHLLIELLKSQGKLS